MSLITPDFGLIFWMTLIFAIVFFLLAKFGFPVITDMVEKRQKRINQSISDAREIEARMAEWKEEYTRMVDESRREQAGILREAAETKARIIEQAREEARDEAEKILAKARTEIAAEKASALMEVRREVALLSVEVAEKVLRRELSDADHQQALIDSLVEEATEKRIQS